MKVGQIMTTPALTLCPNTTLDKAATRMFQRRIAAMPVVEGGHLVGIVGEADLYRAVAAAHGVPLGGTVPFDALGRPHIVSDIMRREVLWVNTTDNVQLAAQLLMRHARSLPVLDHGQVVGMVSRRDVIGPLIRGKSIAPVDHVPDDVAMRYAAQQAVSLIDPDWGSIATVDGWAAEIAGAARGVRPCDSATNGAGSRH